MRASERMNAYHFHFFASKTKLILLTFFLNRDLHHRSVCHRYGQATVSSAQQLILCSNSMHFTIDPQAIAIAISTLFFTSVGLAGRLILHCRFRLLFMVLIKVPIIRNRSTTCGSVQFCNFFLANDHISGNHCKPMATFSTVLRLF